MSPTPLPDVDPELPASVTDDAGARRKERPLPLSQVLAGIAQDTSLERIALSHLVEVMQARAFGALLIVFAFPNMLPAPPGLAGILGVPLLILSGQMALGIKPWLPQVIGKRSMPRESFAALINRAGPWLARAERLMRSRWFWASSEPAQRFLGVMCVIVTILLMLPVPLGNVPPSFAMVVVGLGILERDGLWILVGVLLCVAASVWVALLGYALVKSAIFVILNAF